VAYKIIISQKVYAALNSTVLYLENKWSGKVATEFLSVFYKKVDQLSNNPNSGIRTEKNPAIRKKIITKHNILYYRVVGKEVRLLKIVFAKQNPEKNTFE
jgi:plasmid stabilization system protein ParE